MKKKIFNSILSLSLLLALLASCVGNTDNTLTPSEKATESQTVASDNSTEITSPEEMTPGNVGTTIPGVTSDLQTSTELTTDKYENQSPEINLKYTPKDFGFDSSVEYTFVVDANTNEVIFINCDKDAKIYPASVTKLVAAIVALEYCKENEKFTVGDERSLVAYDSSLAGLKKGDTLTLGDLIYCLLLPSGGDAAYTIAAGVGAMLSESDASLTAKQAVSAFVEEMNVFASEIGMNGTSFTCPDGYHDPNHYTTVEDMAKLGVYCANYEPLEKYTSCYSITVTTEDGRRLVLKNSNALVNESSPYYHSGVYGLKTGTTDEAGYCLLSCGDIKGKKYVVGTFAAKSTVARFFTSNEAYKRLWYIK